MELILELLYESRKSYIEWKQIICAVFLALLFSGMYYYMSVQAGYEMRGRKEMAVSADSCVSSGMETGRELLPDIFWTFLAGTPKKRNTSGTCVKAAAWGA